MSGDLDGGQLVDDRFQRLVENSAIATTLMDPDGRIVYANRAMCDMLGYDSETLLTMTWRQVTAPDHLFNSREVIEDIMAGRRDSHRFNWQYIDATGKRVWGQVTLSCLRGADGAVEHLIGQVVDIADQIELRARRAESDARFRRLMETSNVGMALATPDGKFDVVNKALCDMLGYDEETLKTKTWQDITPARYMESDIKHVEDLLAGRLDTYRVIKEHIHADGHGVWTDLSVSCLRDPHGAVQYLAGQLVDISEEVEAQEQLAQREMENRLLAGRLQAELRDAADYVESVLPGDLHGAVEVSSRYLPALDLGGDVFHYRWLDDDHLEVYLIDVSGHGVRAALLSMSIHNLIRSGSLPMTTLLSPDRVLTKLNSAFQMDDQGGGYFTIWYGIYQHSTRTLRYASAGHPPALALNRGGDGVSAIPLGIRANPIGMFRDSVYASDSYTVPVGGQLLLYSDGAFELIGDSGAATPFFLKDFVNVCTELAAQPDWSLDGLVDRLRALGPGGEFEDDCALVLLTFP